MYMRLDDMDFKNKRVLVRVDFNVPLKDNVITDDSRIRKAIPTLKYILDKQAKQVIVISHLGRPDGEVKPEFSLRPVAEKLGDLLDHMVVFIETPQLRNLEIPENRLIVLENLRFDPGEKKGDKTLAKALAGYADIFVFDAFGAAHRAHASVTGIPEHLPTCAGMIMEKEIDMLSKVVHSPDKPFNAIIGGAKSDKIDVIKNLLPKVDHLIIGGILANTFLKAKGVDIKGSKFDEETLNLANEILEAGDKVILPIDAIAASEFSDAAEKKEVSLIDIPEGWMVLDIGPGTIKLYTEILSASKTVVWGGPIGVFEMDSFAEGTKEIARCLANIKATTVIGGGDSGAAITKFGFEDKVTWVSTGGGASLEFLSGKVLPGVKALEDNARRFRKR